VIVIVLRENSLSDYTKRDDERKEMENKPIMKKKKGRGENKFFLDVCRFNHSL
jgi:hypothetical protein